MEYLIQPTCEEKEIYLAQSSVGWKSKGQSVILAKASSVQVNMVSPHVGASKLLHLEQEQREVGGAGLAPFITTLSGELKQSHLW
jgi:hypothetical protein